MRSLSAAPSGRPSASTPRTSGFPGSPGRSRPKPASGGWSTRALSGPSKWSMTWVSAQCYRPGRRIARHCADHGRGRGSHEAPRLDRRLARGRSGGARPRPGPTPPRSRATRPRPRPRSRSPRPTSWRSWRCSPGTSKRSPATTPTPRATPMPLPACTGPARPS